MPSPSKSRARAQEYKRRLKALRKIGAYNPQPDSAGNVPLTDHRKARINALWRQYGEYVDDPRKKYFFVPADELTPKRRKKFLKDAESLNIKTSPRGLFLQREGQRRAKIVYDREHREMGVRLTGKIKWGENKGKRITDLIPITSADHVEQELDKLEAAARSYGTLKRGEAVSFVVIQNDQIYGASRDTFSNAALLRKRLAEYHVENKGHALAFLRLVKVRKTTLIAWGQEHQPRKKKMARRGKIPKGYNGK